jgi:DNA-binding SARP family transcriptional activator
VKLEVRLLGPWEFVSRDGAVSIPSGRLRVLLTALLLSANQPVGVDTLAEQLWPEQPPMRVRGSLHTYVGRLRKLLGPAVIQTHPGGAYQLNIDTEAVDIHRFRNLLKQARDAGSADDELDRLQAALRLWRGTPFADLYSTWLDREVLPRLTEEWFAATGRRIELELAAGRSEQLIAELRGLTSKYPARESLWLLLVTALHRAGRRADALDAYQRVRTILHDELGIEPGDALIKLQREILHEGGAPAQNGNHRPGPIDLAPRQLPHDIARFTGRLDELAALNALLPDPESAQARRAPTIVSIDGAAGVGKTTLAVHWAHQAAHRYPDAQLHLNLRGYGPGKPVTPDVAAESLLRALGVDSELIPSHVDERSALLRSTLSGMRALILLDNARDAEQVRPLLPGHGGLVIVTSRSQLRGLSIRDGAHRVTLNRLARQQSVELLAAAVGPKWVADDPDAAAALADLCDHLPLAIAIVAERAQRAGSLAEVVAELENEQARLDTLNTGEDANVRAALAWSYRALGHDAAAMFRILGLHPGVDIGVDAAAALADVAVAKAKWALDQLVAAHLAGQPRPHRYELHDLIRLYAAELVSTDDEDCRSAAIRRGLDWYLHAAANADRLLNPRRLRLYLEPYAPGSALLPEFTSLQEARAWFEQEYESLRAVATWAGTNGFAGHAWRIAITMTTFFDHAIPWRDGVEFFKNAFAIAEKAGDRTGEGYTLNSLGCIYLDMTEWRKARSYFEQALRRFQDLEYPFGVVIVTGNLALANGELGDDDAAREYATDALAVCRELGHIRGTCSNLDNLGVVYARSGAYDEAIECYEQAISASRQLGDTDIESGSWHHLAQAYVDKRDYPNATRAFRMSILCHRNTGNLRWEATVLAEMAEMLVEAGHPAIAKSMWQSALNTLQEFADPRAQDVETAIAALEPTPTLA